MDRGLFSPLHYPERLRIVNDHGDVGLVTLWSPIEAAVRRLEVEAPDLLHPSGSRLAVIANLYGDGMFAMFCNLLYNPQVCHLVAVGQDLGLPTCAEIEAFLEYGLEDAELLGHKVKRIIGTNRLFPDVPGFDAGLLRRRLTFHYVGSLSSLRRGGRLQEYIDSLPRSHGSLLEPRLQVEVPSVSLDSYTYRPSDATGHQVARRYPLDSWKELLVRVMRFGRPVTLRSGPRLELLNVKAVISEPTEEPADVLAEYGFELSQFEAYQLQMLRSDLPENISYTYGNRLRGGYSMEDGDRDALARVVAYLKDDVNTRRGYISLWDTAVDLAVPADEALDSGAPCLTSVYFRRVDDRLAMTATFRSHNMLRAWLENVYGLIGIQRHVAEEIGMLVGSLTIFSQSLTVDPRDPRFELARKISDRWSRDDDIDRATGRHVLRRDPCGYFEVSVDFEANCIVAKHRYEGLLIKEYRSPQAAKIERAVAGDMAISLVSHALWLGRQLAQHERMLKGRLQSIS